LHQSGTFTLGAADGSLTPATSTSFVISPDIASHLVFTGQPGNINAGALGTVAVTVEDQYNNIVTTDSSTVTLTLASGAGALLGTLNVAAVNGVATFNSLGLHSVGTYTLGAADSSLSGAVSNSFTVSPAAASKIVFTSQPSSMVAGNLLSGI